MNEELDALIELHLGLDRQGPGARDFSLALLAALPPLPPAPRIADLGCGSGAGACLLAEYFQVPLRAVDLCGAFLERLRQDAANRGLTQLIQTIEADMGALDWPDQSLDLIWSEGAAYNLTFPGALKAWRPLLASGGLAVISELSWFCAHPAETPRDFWGAAYPTLATEEENMQHAIGSGFEVLLTRRLPSAYWWEFYYGPLQARMDDLKSSTNPHMHRVLQATKEEMDLFRGFSADFGYTFYVLRAV